MLLLSLLVAYYRVDVEEHVKFDEPCENKKEKIEHQADEAELAIQFEAIKN